LTTLSAAGTAGTMARYLVPGAVLVPLAVGAAIHHGALLSAGVELSVFALTSSVILTAITWWAMNLGVVAEQERKANQDQLQRSQRRLATTLSSLGDAVVTTDAAAVITGLNPAAESLLGTTEVEARGRQFAEIVRLVDVPNGGTDLATLALRAGARVAAPDHRPLVGADGVRPITYTAAPIVGDDAVVEGAVVVLHDAAERVRVQEALSSSNRLASLGTLSAGIAHEINNPLTVVDLNLEMLRRQLEAGGGRPIQLLDHIDEGLKRVTAIVRDMRIFARGDALVPRQPVDLHAVIESALRIVAHQIRQRARLNLELCPVPPVLASESQLGQVLVNLFSNAIDAIPEGAVDDHLIAVGTARADDERVAIWVRDTGVGMSPALRAQLFTPFHTTKPVGAGTGLGLAISRGLVESMGGTIEVESEEGRGSTFRVLLPVATGRAPVPPIVPERSAPPVAASRLRVLVVDDEWALARALAVSLGRSHDAVAVQSGAEALARLGNDPSFDAVVCDLSMPGMSGLELYRHASAAWPHMAARFVFMTGGAPAPDVAAFLSGVTGGYLLKPFTVEALEERLHSVTATVVSTDG
jgi:PAS domain S-box-containing protein